MSLKTRRKLLNRLSGHSLYKCLLISEQLKQINKNSIKDMNVSANDTNKSLITTGSAVTDTSLWSENIETAKQVFKYEIKKIKLDTNIDQLRVRINKIRVKPYSIRSTPVPHISADSRSHTANTTGVIRPYVSNKCPLCGQQFVSNEDSKRHILSAHIDQQMLTKHLAASQAIAGPSDTSQQSSGHTATTSGHMGYTPIKCPFCNQQYVSSDDYKRHIMSHIDTNTISQILSTRLATLQGNQSVAIAGPSHTSQPIGQTVCHTQQPSPMGNDCGAGCSSSSDCDSVNVT